VCQAGEARALAAAARRLAAPPQVWAAGHADAIATLIRRALTRTKSADLEQLETNGAAGRFGERRVEKVYCARGDMENRIKECQLDLYGVRSFSPTTGYSR
jgi:hypothetical protein